MNAALEILLGLDGQDMVEGKHFAFLNSGARSLLYLRSANQLLDDEQHHEMSNALWKFTKRIYQEALEHCKNSLHPQVQLVVATGISGSGKSEITEDVLSRFSLLSDCPELIQKFIRIVDYFGKYRSNSTQSPTEIVGVWSLGIDKFGYISALKFEPLYLHKSTLNHENLISEMLPFKILIEMESSEGFEMIKESICSRGKKFRYMGETAEEKEVSKFKDIINDLESFDIDVVSVIHVLNAVLWIGELNSRENETILHSVSDLLQIPAHVLSHHLLSSENNKETNRLKQEEFAKSLYSRLFLHLVSAVNKYFSRKLGNQSHSQVLLVDAIGFSDSRYSEMFLRNLASEQTKSFVIQNTLFNPIQNCKDEGIDAPFEFRLTNPIKTLPEMQSALELAEEKFLVYIGGENREISKPETKSILINHEEGPISYLDREMQFAKGDSLELDTADLFNWSSCKFIRSLFQLSRHSSAESIHPYPIDTYENFFKGISSTRFRLWNIHCVKIDKEDDSRNISQIKSHGTLDLAAFYSNCFSVDYFRDSFKYRYRNLCKETGSELGIMNSVGGKEGIDFVIGRSKIFLKSLKILYSLEDSRNSYLETDVCRCLDLRHKFHWSSPSESLFTISSTSESQSTMNSNDNIKSFSTKLK
jgi:hypothetical protein